MDLKIFHLHSINFHFMYFEDLLLGLWTFSFIKSSAWLDSFIMMKKISFISITSLCFGVNFDINIVILVIMLPFPFQGLFPSTGWNLYTYIHLLSTWLKMWRELSHWFSHLWRAMLSILATLCSDLPPQVGKTGRKKWLCNCRPRIKSNMRLLFITNNSRKTLN